MTLTSEPRRIGAVSLAGATLVVILTVAACGDHEQSRLQSYSDVDTTLLTGGLVVCTSRRAANPPGTNALESQVLEVGSTDPGKLSAAGQNSEGSDTCAPMAVTRVTVSRYADQNSRDAGARALQALVRPGDGTAIHTTGDLTILVASGTIDSPSYRVNEVLSTAGR